jgi:hypothetical protein
VDLRGGLDTEAIRKTLASAGDRTSVVQSVVRILINLKVVVRNWHDTSLQDVKEEQLYLFSLI